MSDFSERAPFATCPPFTLPNRTGDPVLTAAMAFFQAGLRRTVVLCARLPVSCSKSLLFQTRFRSAVAAPFAGATRRRDGRAAAAPLHGFFAQAEHTTALSRSLATAAATAAAAPVSTPTASSTGSARKSSFPETSSKAVAYWLIGSAVSVFGIVVWGGLTRLTESG